MPKRKKPARRALSHRSPRNTYALFRTKIFYFLGLAVLILFVIAQSVKPHVSSQNVLSDSSGGGDSNSGSSGGGGNSGSGEHQNETQKAQTSQPQQTPTEVHIQQQETEIKSANGTVVKTKVEDNGAVKIEGARQGFQFKLESENGNTQFHIEDAKGNELHESEQEQLENELESEGVEVSTEDGKLAITKHDVKALSELPLSVDTTRRQIMVTTPNGNTVAIILPDAAIQNLMKFGILTSVASGSGTLGTGTPSGSLLTLSSTNNIPTYLVPGFKDERLLGVVPVHVPVDAVVSAETGALMQQNQNFFSQLLDALSF